MGTVCTSVWYLEQNSSSCRITENSWKVSSCSSLIIGSNFIAVTVSVAGQDMDKQLKWEKNSSMEELCHTGTFRIVDLVAHVHWFHSCDCAGWKHMLIEVLT
jgi:hypothetical protein